MTTARELIDWLKSLEDQDARVAIDDGGLTLIVLDANGEETDAYYEVGGVPGSIFGDE